MPTVEYTVKVEQTLSRVEASGTIHPDNKAAIREFIRDLRLEDLSEAWLSKLSGHLVIIAEHLRDTRFEDMTKGDVKDLVEWVKGRTTRTGEPVSPATVSAYKQVIKRFWRWLYDLPRGEHPDQTAWINTGSDKGKGTLPTDLLTRADVGALKDGTRNPRDRAFIAMLYETGARIGELIDLTVGDIEDNKHGRKVVIDGKTGERRLPLLECVSPLNKWLNDHPDARPHAPLWCKINSPESVSYHYVRQKLLERAGKRAARADPKRFANDPTAIDDPDREVAFHKPLNPHHFRHSRATELASRDEFNEYKLCEWFGWAVGSKVPARYVHLSGKDIDDAYARMHGLTSVDEDEAQETVTQCMRCQELNETGDRFCSRCGHALDTTAVNEVEVSEDKVTDASGDVHIQLAVGLLKEAGYSDDELDEMIADLD